MRTGPLYRALFGLSALRDEIRALAPEMTPADQSRLLYRVEILEAAAVELVDEYEQRARIAEH